MTVKFVNGQWCNRGGSQLTFQAYHNTSVMVSINWRISIYTKMKISMLHKTTSCFRGNFLLQLSVRRKYATKAQEEGLF